MSGGTKQKQEATSAPVIPQDILDLYKKRTEMVSAGQPQFQELINAGLTGDASKVEPYIRANYAPMGAATDNAISQLRRQTPRGGAQDMAIAQMMQQGAMQKGQMSQQLMTRLLDYYATMAGAYNPEKQIGQTQKGTATTKEPFMLKIGDAASIPIG